VLLRLAATSSWILGLGFGMPCLYAVWYLATQGRVWDFLGFPTYGGGPFTRVGIETTVPLLTMFAIVCVAEVGLGWLLWDQSTAGAWIALALLPLELVFWIGFALPYALVLGAARTVLVVVWLVALRGTAT
jgi:hypothetical protein